jgi:hypothetical protein
MKTQHLLLLALSLHACDASTSGDALDTHTSADSTDSIDSTDSTDSTDTTNISDTQGPDATSPPSDHLLAEVTFLEESARISIIPDINGDGRADVIVSSLEPPRVTVHTAWPDGFATEVSYVRTSTGLLAAVGDLNSDGQPDLALSSAWDHKAEVYFGPFDGAAKPRAASFHLSRRPGGLSDRLGGALLIADLNLDGRDDLLVTAPGEGEEACFGTRASLAFFGPLSPGPASAADGLHPVADDEDDGPAPSVILPATPGDCLGDYAFVLPASRGQALVLSRTSAPGRVAYGLPLSAASTPLTEANTPPLPPLHTQLDIDGDGVAEVAALDTDINAIAWTRSSDGARVTLTQSDHNSQLIAVDLDGDGLGAAWILSERFISDSYSFTLTPLPTSAAGPLDFNQLTPRWRGTRSASTDNALSLGDLDGDGIPEAALGNALIRFTLPPK